MQDFLESVGLVLVGLVLGMLIGAWAAQAQPLDTAWAKTYAFEEAQALAFDPSIEKAVRSCSDRPDGTVFCDSYAMTDIGRARRHSPWRVTFIAAVSGQTRPYYRRARIVIQAARHGRRVYTSSHWLSPRH